MFLAFKSLKCIFAPLNLSCNYVDLIEDAKVTSNLPFAFVQYIYVQLLHKRSLKV